MTFHTKVLLSVVTAIVFIGLPQSADAYRVLDQKVTQLTNTTALYTITFGLGFEKYETSVPVRAMRDSGGLGDRTALSYALFSDEETTYDGGDVRAIVLSDAEIDEGMYVVPQGESAQFILAAIVALPETMSRESDLVLGVTYLPFDMTVTNGVTLGGKLNDSELQYYRAPRVDEIDEYEDI